jgi:hypothetical protein
MLVSSFRAGITMVSLGGTITGVALMLEPNSVFVGGKAAESGTNSSVGRAASKVIKLILLSSCTQLVM